MTVADLAKSLALLGRREPPVAICPVCRTEPLVSTLAFRGAEFYCLRCRGRFGFLEPDMADRTPALEARIQVNRERFHVLAAGLIGDGAMLTACLVCRAGEHGTHRTHATKAALVADIDARLRLAGYLGGAA